MADENRSKKERILQLARRDPFLKIEEIATRVETTAPYVRTILSQGRVSLMKLRREYARDWRRRLMDPPPTSGAAAPHLEEWVCAGALHPPEVYVERIVSAELASLLEVESDKGLLQVSAVRTGPSGLTFLTRVVTHRDVPVRVSSHLGKRPLRDILGLEGSPVYSGVDCTLDVVYVSDPIAAQLGMMPCNPVLRIQSVLVWAGRREAVEITCFPADRVRVVAPGTEECRLLVKERLENRS